jgi:Flp pilus assembly pilin Flp
MPGSLATALVLVHALFAITVLGGLGVLLTASSYDAVDGGLLALTAYAAAPGILGWWLARRTWQGGTRVLGGLIAVQAWLIAGSISNIADGSPRGFTQLFLPLLVLWFLTREDSRAWYRLPAPDRAERRPFSLPRMIRWRRDEGQTAVEYAGLIAIVVAIIAALLVSGLGTQIQSGLQSAICKVTGTACPSPAADGGTDVTATRPDPADGPGNRPGTDQGGQPHADGGRNPEDQGDGNEGENKGEADGNADGDANGNADGDTGGSSESEDKGDDGCFSGVGAFFGCTGDQLKQVGEGLVVDGIGGELKGIWDTVTNPLDSLEGVKDYGGVIADQWSQDAKDAGDKWAEGDYWDALTDWGGATVNSGGKVLDDMFIGEDVRDQWNQGNETRAVTTVVWNVGSLFIPGYGEAKLVGKAGKLGKLGKLGDLGKLTEKAADAAEDAGKAARAGDVKGAEKAAKEADEAADEAEKKARESGCTIAAPPRRTPYGGAGHPPAPLTGSSGTGTTVLAAGRSAAQVVARTQEGCDEEAKQQAQEARKKADEAARQTLEARAEAAKAALREQGSSVPDDQIDGLVDRAEDDPDPAKAEISTQDAAAALDEITDLARRGNVNPDAAAALQGKVVNASDANKLAEARAEVNAVRRAADDAAPGTRVDAGVGGKMNRQEADLGNGEKVNLDEIPDADVVYKDRNGTVHVKEVKNAGSATRKADFANQVERLKKWAAKEPGRKATVEIETTDRWTSIFSEFKPARNGKPAKDTRTAAGEMAKNDVDVRVAGQNLSADQLGRMQRAIDGRTADGTMDWSRMKDPESAKAYLGIS